jgi:hypothetical protein
MEEARQAKRPESPAAWWTSGRDAQVFVDDSGRRARRMRVAGVAAAALCAFWLVGLAVGMAGFSGFSSIGLHALARAGLKRPPTLRADAIADRSALRIADRSELRLRGVVGAAPQGRVATAELPLRASSCSLSAMALTGHPRRAESRGTSAPVDPRSSRRHEFAGRPGCDGLARPARAPASVRA